MSDLVNRALSKVAQYQDAPNEKVDRVKWRPLTEVHEELEGLPEIPGHVHDFGEFMHKMAAKAAGPGLSGRDLIKAYAITRSSIRRKERNTDLVRQNGLVLPQSVGKTIRPEGAMAEWLKSPMGQRFLDAAEDGKVDREAVAHAQQVMKPFGFDTETQALPWAVENLAGKHELVSHLVKLGMASGSPVKPWRDFATNLHGIKDAKAGFMGSILGRGDLPTLDARQVILNTGMPTKEVGSKLSGAAGAPAVDRLAARQAAMNPKMDPGMEPFRQHLTHHAIWDKAANATTTHSDLMDTMQHAATGGRIGKAGGGSRGGDKGESEKDILSHAMATAGGPGHELETDPEKIKALLKMHSEFLSGVSDHGLFEGLARTSGYNPKAKPEDAQAYMRRFYANKNNTINLHDIWKINDPDRRAAAMAAFNRHNVDVGSTKKMTGGYYNVAQSMSPKDVQVTETDIPGVSLKPRNPMSWTEALEPFKGGTLIGLGGDRSRVGRITHINGKKLEWPIDAHGGADYMLEANKGQVWANAESHAKSLEKMIRTAAERGPVAGVLNPMGAQSIQSSHNMVDALMAQIKGSGISKADAKAFDDALRRGEHASKKTDIPKYVEKMKNWPGILNSKAASEFMRPENGFAGTHRTDIANFMDSKVWRQKGFPEVGVTRAALTHPELLGARKNMTGFRMVKLDPQAALDHIRDSGYRHSSYQVPNFGEYHADVPLAIRPDVFKTHAEAMLGKDVKGGHVVSPFGPSSLGESTYGKLSEQQKPWEKVDEETGPRADASVALVNRLMREGRNTGGAVQPTDAQKEAGNYRKEHISFQGLPISIETRKGQTRSGTDANGKKWSVKLPYDYGYIKRTEGADGDHVDVCIGPHHQSDHVFVVDQHDHRDGKFDEHKVMLGYRTKSEAEHAYIAGFSDGKGHVRMKNVSAMPMAQFKQWLKRGNTKKPIERAMKMTSLYSLGRDRDAG